MPHAVNNTRTGPIQLDLSIGDAFA